jgi:16S rRNA (guanine527-N7)-methyltransferase
MSHLSKQHILEVLNNSKLGLNGVQFSDEMIDRFLEFCTILQKWNHKINLTSEKDALSIFERHVFDSLQYLRWLDPCHKTLDIGSGAGFPGIPIKVIHPDLDLILLDSQKKRCSFLREAIRILRLERIEVAEGRVESFFNQDSFSEQFDRVCFRGYSSLENCLSVGLPFLKTGGRIILKKGANEMPDSGDEIRYNARIIASKQVEGFEGQGSLMMVIEKCST